MTGIGHQFRQYAAFAITAVLAAIFCAVFIREFGEEPATRESSLWLPVTAAAVAAIAIGTPIQLLLARRSRSRLRGIRRAAEGVAAGDLRPRIHDQADDEIGRLARAFDRTTDELRDRIEDLDIERSKLASILEGMIEGLIATDREHRVVHINAAAERILGVKEQDVLTRSIWEVTRFPQVHQIMRDVMSGADVARAEYTNPKATTDDVIELRASSLVDESGTRNGAIIVIHDVSHLRRLERMRREFVSNVSHELKTPLMAIQGLVETMLDDADMDTETRTRFLARLRNQGDRLGSLVHDLLELSRVETMPPSREDRETLDLRVPVRNSVEHAAAYAQEKGITLTYTEAPEPLEVLGDVEMLRQLVDNLLQNALKYTPGDGNVTITTLRSAGEAVLEVRDSGIGIDAKHLPRIFERFYRVDKARSRSLGGTGLGLSIVKHVAMTHDGSVDVESEEGVGSCFRVTLPLRDTTPVTD